MWQYVLANLWWRRCCYRWWWCYCWCCCCWWPQSDSPSPTPSDSDALYKNLSQEAYWKNIQMYKMILTWTRDLSIFLHNHYFLKKWAIPGLFSVYICLYKQILQFYRQIYVKKDPLCICCWDTNPHPLEHKSPPIPTRPGLPPFHNHF